MNDKAVDTILRAINRRDSIPFGLSVASGIYIPEQGMVWVQVRYIGGAAANTFRIAVKGEGVDNQGNVFPIYSPFVVTKRDGSEEFFFVTVKQGNLQSLQVYIETDTLVRVGECFVTINLLLERTNIPSNKMYATLAFGYLSNSQGVGHPSFGNVSVDGNGMSTTFRIASLVDFPIPENERWKIDTIFCDVSAIGGATNRSPVIAITQLSTTGANRLVAEIVSSNSLATGQRGFFTFAPAIQDSAFTSGTDKYIKTSFPSFILHAGDSINVSLFGQQGGDTITTNVSIQRWIDVGTNTGTPGGGGGKVT